MRKMMVAIAGVSIAIAGGSALAGSTVEVCSDMYLAVADTEVIDQDQCHSVEIPDEPGAPGVPDPGVPGVPDPGVPGLPPLPDPGNPGVPGVPPLPDPGNPGIPALPDPGLPPIPPL